MDASGEFIICWDSQDTSGYGVYAQRYGADGQPLGGKLQVNTTTDGDQLIPSVAMDANGDFIVAWERNAQDGYGVYAQRYGAGGQPVGGELRVGATTEGYPTVAIDGRGDFLVAWQSFGADGDVWRVHGQRYGTSGQRLGSEFLIAGSGPPSVALDGSGDFVVVWVDNGVL